jgi:TonB family protein
MSIRVKIACVGLIGACLGLSGSVSAKESPEDKGRPLLKAAAAQSLLHPDGHSSAQVKLNFQIRSSSSKAMQGSYSQWFNSAGEWRKDLAVSDYTDIDIGRGSTRWLKRSLDFVPMQAIWAKEIFNNFAQLDDPDEVIERYFTTSEHHIELRCMDMRREKPTRTLCVNEQGNMARTTTGEYIYEYSDFQQVGAKFIPRQVVLKREEQVVLEGTITGEAIDPGDNASLLLPPAGSTERSGCLVPTLPKLAKKTAPSYPQAARLGNKQGRVGLYALIAADGSTHNLQVIQTAGKELDDAAFDAVSHWQYEPSRCGTVAVENDALIWINFTLQR